MKNYFPVIEDDPLVSTNVSNTVNKWDAGIEDNDVHYVETVREYKRLKKLKHVFILACAVIITILSAYSITIGAYPIGFYESYELIWDHITHNITDDNYTPAYIVWNLRLPRVIVAVFGGAALAVAGVVMQSILRNPLADSYTTGVSSGAGFGATFAIATGLTIGLQTGVVVCAFAFALIPMLIIIAVSKFSNASPTTMIMAGIGTMYVFNAFTTVLMLWTDPESMSIIYSWQVGSLGMADWDAIPCVMAVSIVGIAICCIMSGKLNVLATGDESAKALGLNTDNLRIIFLILSAILAAGTVSFIGLVGFVGLVAPHVCRMFIGADNKYLIPSSAVFGATIMLVADQIGRTLLDTPLPVGVVMAFFGGPLFILLILKKSNKAW